VNADSLVITGRGLSIGDVASVARHGRVVKLSDEPEITAAVVSSCRCIRRAVDAGARIYGVTTGYGGMADVEIGREDAEALQVNLVWHLKAGAGRRLAGGEVRAAMLIRANSHLRGASGIGRELLRRLEIFLNAGVTPHVREFGSIGASGDLVPLASITGALIGLDRSFAVDFQGEDTDALTALDRLGLPPLRLAVKEGLAMVNGTAAMTGVAALCLYDAWSQLMVTLGAHALAIQGLAASLEPFHPFIHEHKPHPGQQWSARMIRELLAGSALTRPDHDRVTGPVQDRYSVRCLPQFIGPVVESFVTAAHQVETEINSTTDNPLIDAETGCIHHGGNFFGLYVGTAMDQVRHGIGLLSKHLDTQIALLVTPEFSGGLPPSLVGNTSRPVNMGLKGLQITANSIVPILGFLGTPLVDRFPTHAEQFNQNINSLGFGAAQLARQSVTTYQQYLAIALLIGVQAVDIRSAIVSGQYDARRYLSPNTVPLYEAIRGVLKRPPDRRRSIIWDNHDQALDELVAALVEDLDQGGRVAGAVEPFLPADFSLAP
jgi:phenylalanine ammonia-lyase